MKKLVRATLFVTMCTLAAILLLPNSARAAVVCDYVGHHANADPILGTDGQGHQCVVGYTHYEYDCDAQLHPYNVNVFQTFCGPVPVYQHCC